ncbi:MAG: Eco57I restriction-modification methylase domain-containing protein, partial [Bacteroidales bacterium]|nr:Eco57I restriction-modification methylase domain-containing protein [Bacteroidales bacterium]
QSIAVEISKLRFFLSLTVDANIDTNKDNWGIEPLPNLEFKFVAANSLIGLPNNQQPDLEDYENINKLKSLRIEYFRSSGKEKQALEKEFDSIQTEVFKQSMGWQKRDVKSSKRKSLELSQWRPFSDESAGWFDAEWMFGVKDGFDVVIGNPPWGIQFNKNEKKVFKEKYTVAKGIIDSFSLFIEKGTSLIHETGVFAMILPDIILLKAYPATRKFLLDNYCLTSASFWGIAFKSVNLDSCTIIGIREQDAKMRSENQIKSSTKGFAPNGELSLISLIPQSFFMSNTDLKFNLYWNPEIERLKLKLKRTGKRFDELFNSHEGIHTGNIRNKLFVDNKIDETCKPLIFGRDEIRALFLKWNGKYVRYNPKLIDRSKGEYANLAHKEYFTQVKMMIRRTGDHIIAVVDRNGFYASNNLFVCIPKTDINMDYIATILNSSLITWYFRSIQPRTGRLFAELKLVHLNEFPIPLGDKRGISLISSLGQKAAKAQATNSHKFSEILNEINLAVFHLYNLSNSEIEIIKNSYTDNFNQRGAHEG